MKRQVDDRTGRFWHRDRALLCIRYKGVKLI